MLQKSNFSSLSPRLDWMYKVRDTFWWIVQKTDLVFGQICRNWTLSFWPTDRACSQTSNFHPFSPILCIHKKTRTSKVLQVNPHNWWWKAEGAHLTLLKMLMRTRKSVTSIAILKVRVKLLRHASTSKKILWKIANERAVPFTLKMKLFGFWINAAVIWEFLDQCSWYLGKAFSLFGWLCFDRYWQQNWKLTTEPSFILE